MKELEGSQEVSTELEGVVEDLKGQLSERESRLATLELVSGGSKGRL